MKLPQIRLESTFIQHGIRIQKPIQEMEQTPADLQIHQQASSFEIDKAPAKLTIDQTQAWEDMHLKSIFRLIEENADYGKQKAFEAVGRISSDGDELMKGPKKGRIIVDQARRNSTEPMREINIGYIPSSFSVKINYEPDKIDINWNIEKPEINVATNPVRHNYTPGSVEGEIDRWNDLKIDFINLYA